MPRSVLASMKIRVSTFRLLLTASLFYAASPVVADLREDLGDGKAASLSSQSDLYLEAAPLRGEGLYAFARRLCGTDSVAGRISAVNGGRRQLEAGVRYKVPFDLLLPAYQVQVVRKMFPSDEATAAGWEHYVAVSHTSAQSGLAQIARWFTGSSANASRLAEVNGITSGGLAVNQQVRIPTDMLQPQFQGMLPSPPPSDLSFGEDSEGEYALYRLKAGEALYSAVVVRFTGNVYADDVNALAREVATRSGIRDVTDIPIGYSVKIPLELVLPEFLPADHARRIEYEENRIASEDFGNLPRLSHLDGVTIILDAGHGGKDVGASKGAVWESLYVYDIMVRTKRLLEERTSATVIATTRDGPTFDTIPRDVLPFSRGHAVLTTPSYQIEDSTVGAHLRWYLANSVNRQALARHGDPTKVMFLSIHADSLHPSLRGAMVYVPAASLRSGSYGKSGHVYAKRREVRERPRVSFSSKDLRRSEGLSRELGNRLLSSFRSNGLPVHEYKPMRDRIIRGRRTYVPAVLRYNSVLPEVLFEVCNLANSEDRRLIQTQAFRQKVAASLVEGILGFYGYDAGTATQVAASR